MESRALLLAQGCETGIRESLVGMEIVKTLSVADAVNCGRHCELGRKMLDSWKRNVVWKVFESAGGLAAALAPGGYRQDGG